MNLHQTAIFIFSALVASGCGSTVPVVRNISPPAQPEVKRQDSIRKETAPEWVTQRASSEYYYFGTGNARLSEPDYQSEAKRKALDDLASEIKVHISSSVILFNEETSKGFKEDYKSFIASKTELDLENYEMTDSWTDGTFHWVCYRLSKSEYLRLKNEKKEKAMAIALDYFTGAQAALDGNRFPEVINFCLKALASLELYLGDDTRIMLANGQTILLANEIFSTLQNTLSGFSISGPGKVSLKRKNVSRYGTDYTMIFQKGAVRINSKNLPVSFFNSQKEFALTSDEHGRLSVSGNMLASFGETLHAGINLKTYTSGMSVILLKLLGTLHIPQMEIEVVFLPVTAYIDTREYNLNKRLSGSLLKPILLEVLHTRGIRFTDSLSNADVLIKLDANTRKGTELSGLYSAYLDIAVTVKDLTDNKEIFGDRLTDIKAIRLSFEDAGVAAYGSAKKAFEDQLANTLVKSLMD